MSAVGIAVLGAGSLRCAPAIVGSLCTYFGERPLEVLFFDSDPERLELFYKLARGCFTMTKSTHLLMVTDDPREAVLTADRVILALDVNGANKYVKANHHLFPISPVADKLMEAVLPAMLESMPVDASVLSLLGREVRVPLPKYFRLDWPEPLSDANQMELGHQILRWIRSDEYLHEFIAKYERSPLKTWLDDVLSATLVSEIQESF